MRLEATRIYLTHLSFCIRFRCTNLSTDASVVRMSIVTGGIVTLGGLYDFHFNV
jgi:hypothetical protein